MDELRKQVRRARFRLALQRFLGVLGWCWFGTFMVALGLITGDKFYPLGVAARGWAAGALGLGLVAAVVWMIATRRRPLLAAMEIDHRFGLKERVSSALALPPADRQTEAGAALLADAVRRVQRIDVRSRFGVAPGKQVFLPFLPGLASVLVALLVSPAVVENPAAATPATPTIKKEVKRSTETLRRQLAQRREEAQKQGLKEAEELFKKLEEGSRDMAAGKVDREKALVKLNDLARELQQRRRELGTADKMKQQLDQVRGLDRGPGDKLAQALRKGDFQKAAEELQKLKEQLANSKLDDKQRQVLAKQLQQMQDKLNRMADAHRQAQNELAQQRDQARKAGRSDEANRLQEQLEKLLQQAPQMKQFEELADKLAECAQAMKDGNLDRANQALDELQSQLGDLQQQLEEMEMLDDAMELLAQARDRMNCSKCGGMGCEACDGLGDGEKEGLPGFGLGRGRGQGDRPEERTETAAYDSQVRQKPGPGAAVVVGEAPGPNIKGEATAAVRETLDSARQGSTDPLTDTRIPRRQREHAREYFDRFLQGQ